MPGKAMMQQSGYVEVGEGLHLYYESHGEGDPLVFIHAWSLSTWVWWEQVHALGEKYRVITLDLRGHGSSSKTWDGHTVAQYGRDIRHFLMRLRLKNVVLIGWSIGCAVIQEYLKQFGRADLKAVVFDDQSPYFFKEPGWRLGLKRGNFTPQDLHAYLIGLQTNRFSLSVQSFRDYFYEPPPEETLNWLIRESFRTPTALAACISYDLAYRDFRPMLKQIRVPTLLFFGVGGNTFLPETGEYMKKQIPESKLVLFEKSGHCLHLEETEKFNRELARWVSSL